MRILGLITSCLPQHVHPQAHGDIDVVDGDHLTVHEEPVVAKHVDQHGLLGGGPLLERVVLVNEAILNDVAAAPVGAFVRVEVAIE